MPRKKSASISFTKVLKEELKDKEFAAAYLTAAIEENDYISFMKAIRNVVDAQGGIGKLAKKTGQNRESLYKTLSGVRNPKVNTLDEILHALGCQLSVKIKKAS